MSTSSSGAPIPGRGLRSSSLVRVKIEVVAPIPIARVSAATSVAVRCFIIIRAPTLRSCQRLFIKGSP
jgi:hypothetical protein